MREDYREDIKPVEKKLIEIILEPSVKAIISRNTDFISNEKPIVGYIIEQDDTFIKLQIKDDLILKSKDDEEKMNIIKISKRHILAQYLCKPN